MWVSSGYEDFLKDGKTKLQAPQSLLTLNSQCFSGQQTTVISTSEFLLICMVVSQEGGMLKGIFSNTQEWLRSCLRKLVWNEESGMLLRNHPLCWLLPSLPKTLFFFFFYLQDLLISLMYLTNTLAHSHSWPSLSPLPSQDRFHLTMTCELAPFGE